MAALAIVDAGFAGFRAAAGRNGRIFKSTYYRHAILYGSAAGALLVAGLAGVTALALFVSDAPVRLYAELLAMGVRMLIVLGSYALLVVVALLVYLFAGFELRTLATVTLLGPLTLLRTPAVVVAVVAGVSAGGSAVAITLCVGSSAAVLLVARALDRWWARPR